MQSYRRGASNSKMTRRLIAQGAMWGKATRVHRVFGVISRLF